VGGDGESSASAGSGTTANVDDGGDAFVRLLLDTGLFQLFLVFFRRTFRRFISLHRTILRLVTCGLRRL
jgi:hypothetical protein